MGLIVAILGFGGVVLAQESEFQAKLQEDLDPYKPKIVEHCVASDKLAIKWSGKLGFNPRDSEKPDWNAISTLCTSGLDGIDEGCRSNGMVKKAFGKLKTITCTKGKGTLAYKLSGGDLTLSIDPSFTKNNPAGQEVDLVAKLKKDLDK